MRLWYITSVSIAFNFYLASYFIFSWYVDVFPSTPRDASHPVFSVYNGTPFALRNLSIGCKPRGAEFGLRDVEYITSRPESGIDLKSGKMQNLSCLARMHEDNRFEYIVSYDLLFAREYKTMPFRITRQSGLSVIRDDPLSTNLALEYSGAR